MAHEILQLKQVHPTVGYSHEARAGNTLYIAGQIAKDLDGNIVGLGDLETQVRQAHTNLKTILEEVGGSLSIEIFSGAIMAPKNGKPER